MKIMPNMVVSSIVLVIVLDGFPYVGAYEGTVIGTVDMMLVIFLSSQ
jgi:hypothetical protein